MCYIHAVSVKICKKVFLGGIMSVDKPLKEFGKSIRFARIEHNLTQKELAAKLGLTRSQIQKIENGEGNTYIKTIERLLDEFNVPCEVKFIKKTGF